MVEEALTETFDNVDMAPYDFDKDGWVDRLLVIHTGDAQEDGGGQNSIWSHYAPSRLDLKQEGNQLELTPWHHFFQWLGHDDS